MTAPATATVVPPTPARPELAFFDDGDEDRALVSISEPILNALYIDHRAKTTGPSVYDAALEVLGFAHNDDSGAERVVIYHNLLDDTTHTIALSKWLEACEIRCADGRWNVVPRFIRITGAGALSR